MAVKGLEQDEENEEELDLDLPSDREYATPEGEQLDAALVTAIRAADAAGNDYLATLLRTELGSHYYESRLGE